MGVGSTNPLGTTEPLEGHSLKQTTDKSRSPEEETEQNQPEVTKDRGTRIWTEVSKDLDS